MRIISKKILKNFWIIHPDSEHALRAWHSKTEKAKWKSPSDIKNDYSNASFIANNRVIFNIKGNQYRYGSSCELSVSNTLHKIYWYS